MKQVPVDRTRRSQLYRKGAGPLAFLTAAALLFLTLLTLWLSQSSRHVYKQGANALVIRAVLRADTDSVTAENLAERVRQTIPEADIEVINEAMGRSLLALQEPWIAQMPDFDVTPLPILLEIRHPNLLTQPAEVAGFVKELETVPEVDFVAYNETAHDKLVKLATGTGAIEKHAVRWMLAAIIIAGFASQIGCSLLPSKRPTEIVLLKAVAVWLASWAVAWVFFRGWESTAVDAGEWQRLGTSLHFTVGICAGAVIIASGFIGWLIRQATS